MSEFVFEELTKYHFYKYVEWSNYWIDALGLGDFEIRYLFCEGNDEDPRAQTSIEDIDNRLIFITLFDKWDIKPNDRNLCRVAFHEICEALLMDLQLLALNRFGITAEGIDRESHRVIRRLEMLMEKIYDGKINLRETGDSEGQEISEDDLDSSVPGNWLQRAKRYARERINSISSCKRARAWWRMLSKAK
jgi:hypothetical protein